MGKNRYTSAQVIVRSDGIYQIFKETIVLNPTRFEGLTVAAVVDTFLRFADIRLNDGISRDYLNTRILAFVREYPGTGIVCDGKEAA